MGAQCVLYRIDDGSDCGARLRWIPRWERRGSKGRWSGSLVLAKISVVYCGGAFWLKTETGALGEVAKS